ncbi:C40 family peptidase [Streptacidiphilus sp. 4-A2]|nr:C40 family peptidase [Streptacidiphilus sp. 4-A2]
MYWAWRHAGVSLPRTSQEQAFAGRRIPLSDARPGDLVIYFGDMHHVGMYAGNGMVIHAPYPGARVRYERATDMPIAEVVRI